MYSEIYYHFCRSSLLINSFDRKTRILRVLRWRTVKGRPVRKVGLVRRGRRDLVSDKLGLGDLVPLSSERPHHQVDETRAEQHGDGGRDAVVDHREDDERAVPARNVHIRAFLAALVWRAA